MPFLRGYDSESGRPDSFDQEAIPIGHDVRVAQRLKQEDLDTNPKP